MKTKKSLKRIMSLALVTTISSMSLVSVAYADDPTVTWRETVGRNPGTVQTISETYDPATGTFGAAGRVINYTNSGSAQRYLLGAVLPEEITSGKIVVDAEFSDITLPTDSDTYPFFLFSVASSSSWDTVDALSSNLVIRDSGNHFQLDKDHALNDSYRARWNPDLVTLTPGSGYKIDPIDGAHKMRFTAEAADSSDNWTMKIYHEKFGYDAPVYTYTISRADLPDLKYILNYKRVAKDNTLAITVDKFQVTEQMPPEVESATDGNVAYDQPLSVTFDSALDPTTVGGIQLKQGETVIPADVTLDQAGTTVTIAPEAPLIDDESYQIVIPETVKSTEGIYANETVINLKAVDALYFTNLSSQYNPTAVIGATGGSADRWEIKDNELVLIKQTGYGSYKFELPSAVSEGVYYADMKFTALRNGSSNPYGKIRVSSSTKHSVVLEADDPGSNTSISSMTPTAGGYVADTSDPKVYPAEGVYDLRLIIMSESATADWKVLLYDKNTGKITHGWTIERSQISDFASISMELNNMRFKISELIIREAGNVNVISADYDETNKSLTATLAAARTGVAIAAAFDADERFLEAVFEEISPDTTTSAPENVELTFTTNQNINKVQFMIWDNTDNCTPLIGALTYE